MSDLYGKFDIADGIMYAYMPSNDTEERCWTVEFKRGDELVHRETIPMVYAPIFGPDVGDVNALNYRIEGIITELGLE